MSSYGRLRLLAGALVLCATALLVSRGLLLNKPSPPPASAGAEAHLAYWQKRIKDDISDVDAYVSLGTMEERLGFFMAAVRHLTAARALGASDARVSGPLGRALLSLARDDEALPELEKAAKSRPNDLDAALNLAGFYVTRGQAATGASLLKQYADANPVMVPDALRRMAYAQMECGNEAEALVLADRVLVADASDPVAHGLAARCALARKDFLRANRHTQKLVVLSDGEAGVHFLHGLTLEALARPDAAVEHWRKTVERNPAALDAHERLGETYYRRGDYASAARHFEALAGRAPNVLTTGRAADAYTRLKDKGRAAYWRAVQVGLAGDFRSALALAKVAEASADPAVRRKGLQAAAEAYRGLRQKDRYLSAMLRLTAGGTPADLRLRARAYEEVDRHEDRTRCLQQAAETAPDAQKPAFLFDLARAYKVRGLRDEAEKALEEALRRDPKTAAIHRELARLYFERRGLAGRLTQAIRSWEAAVALDAGEAADWQNLGVAYAEAGAPGKAVAALEHAIDLEPGSGPAYLELGRVYAKLGDGGAAKHYNRLYAKYVAFDQERQTLRTRANRPGAPAADLLAYGDLLVKMTALSEAAQQYEKALALTPDDAMLRAKLAALYRRLRQPERLAALQGSTPRAVAPKKAGL